VIREWIQREGRVLGPEYLRVDGFLNHRIAPEFVEAVGEQLTERFSEAKATCVLTAEAAGNVVAYELARRLGARAIYAKKGRASTMAEPLTREIVSPTKSAPAELTISGEYLGPAERVLIVDDFLFRGATSGALADMVRESGARLAGFGFVIEKTFAGGRTRLESYGVPIVALVSIEAMDPATGEIRFVEEAPA
jgi:xanthine phosphoribosyltransferase